jgi:hypothetical protein
VGFGMAVAQHGSHRVGWSAILHRAPRSAGDVCDLPHGPVQPRSIQSQAWMQGPGGSSAPELRAMPGGSGWGLRSRIPAKAATALAQTAATAHIRPARDDVKRDGVSVLRDE